MVKRNPPPIPDGTSRFTAVWANEGGDKVTRNETRATTGAASVVSRAWDGTTAKAFGARNEIVSLNFVLEAKNIAVDAVTVALPGLSGPGGYSIRATPASGDGVFDWTARDIELFYVRYLQIKGLSLLSYPHYDERHVPARFRRPWTGNGIGSGNWTSRPDANKFYPDIAVPLELVPSFTVATGENQSIWADIYIPKDAPPGAYSGNLEIRESGFLTRVVPVQLAVRNFALPDVPSSKTMVYLSDSEINQRYVGNTNVNGGTAQANTMKTVRDRHFLIAHRHKISLIDSNYQPGPVPGDAPVADWLPRLNGTLYTAAHGYRGPGESAGNDIFSIGTYGSWGWKSQGQSGMWTHANAWEQWFQTNSPSTERFLYLVDESTDYAQTEQWAGWVKSNPGVGKTLASFATLNLTEAVARVPSLNTSASTIEVGDTNPWQTAQNAVLADSSKKFYMYNGHHPASGSFATDDDGVALRELAWGQYKKKVHRWFFWAACYYNDYQSGRGQSDVFSNAVTFGTATTQDPVIGETGWNHTNGDGLLLYPGTDTVYPSNSYGVKGPIASLRLKHWRRGIQDIDYVTLASAINPTRVQQLVNQAVPKVLWENGVTNPSDPTYWLGPTSWSTNPDNWEAIRAELADIIENGH